MKAQRLPDSEFDLMQTIWDQQPPVTTGLLMDLIGRSRNWKVQTVVTLLARLTERGFLRVEKGSGASAPSTPSSPATNTCAWKLRIFWSITTTKACTA